MAQQEQLEKDAETLEAMAAIYCRAHHAGAPRVEGRELCVECAELIDYSVHRTSVCPREHKGNCEDCEIRCYEPSKRAGFRQVMKYAAPRMLYRHPVMSARYLKKKLAAIRK